MVNVAIVSQNLFIDWNCVLLSLKVTENRSDFEDLHLYATPREQRFRRFASLEFEGQLYMTPYDFIQAVTSDEPKRKQEFKMLKLLGRMLRVHVIFPFVFDSYFCFCSKKVLHLQNVNCVQMHTHSILFVTRL